MGEDDSPAGLSSVLWELDHSDKTLYPQVHSFLPSSAFPILRKG